MFTESFAIYDAIYARQGKDYDREARRLHGLIQQYRRTVGDTLLDVACGTGLHISFLRRWYTAEGLDVDANMLDIARRRCPNVTFHQGDMVSFDLDHRFDAITCLFSAIGYARSVEGLRQAVGNMARHLYSGGVLIVEPWLTPEAYLSGTVHATFVDDPELKIARINVSEVEGRLAVLEMHYLVGTPQGVRHFTERHELGLFTHQEYLEAFRAAGLDAIHEPQGPIGRGLYIGIRQAS